MCLNPKTQYKCPQSVPDIAEPSAFPKNKAAPYVPAKGLVLPSSWVCSLESRRVVLSHFYHTAIPAMIHLRIVFLSQKFNLTQHFL